MAGTTPNYDPNIPVEPVDENDAQLSTMQPYTPAGGLLTPEGGLVEPTADVGQRDIADYVDPSLATVEGRMTGLLAEGNRFTELAKSRAHLEGQKRGLLSERGTVMAGELAAMQEARAITTPDAQLYGDMSKTELSTAQEGDLNRQRAALEHRHNINTAALKSALVTQEQAGNVNLQQMSDVAQMERVGVDNEWKRTINFDQMDAQDRQSLLSVSQTLGAELTGGIERLLRDPNVTNKTAAISALMDNYRSQMTTSAAVADLTLVWK